MARNAGTVPIGLTITKSELEASRTYSIIRILLSLGCNRAGRENGFFHPVNELFISGTNRGQDATQVGAGGVALANHKIIRAQPHPARHWRELVFFKIKVAGVNQARPVIPLEH